MGITRDDAPRRPTVNSDVMAPATVKRDVKQAPVRSVSFWIVDIVEELGNHGKPTPFQ